ncbi:MAG: FtsX-like permease family protein, partial [bacterium]|nr:FtsX-like permease family protein [bacterium]
SFINIVCLAIGTTACLLLFLWVQDELSYDRFHENADQIYRVIYQLEVEGREKHSAHTPAALAPALINEFPWIQKAIRFGRGKYLVQYKEKRFSEIGLVADHDVLDVFTFTLLTGDSGTVFKDPKSVVISEEMREKYFGKENPIGKTINIDEKYDLKITGVFENIPRNSHITFDFLRPRYKFPGDYATNWGVANYCTYILISPNAPDDMIETFNKRMPQFVEKHMGKNAREFFKIKFILQHLTDIHLTSDIEGEYEPVGDIETVYIISVIAFFILLIVCINYINLATARFITRAREAGLRRVLGATRSQLIRQSLGESFLTALMSLPLAVLLAELFLPLFNSLSGKPLAFHYLSNPILLPGLAGIILFVGLVSGTAPALFITTTLPTDAMKGVVKAGPVISVLRRVLVVFQFAMSILFIICAMIVYVQIQFTRDKDLGFNKEHVVNIHFNHNKEALLQYDTLKYEFSKHPGVKAVSASIFFPGKRPWINNYWLDGMTAKEYLMIYNIPVDYDFIDTFEIDIVEGRGFSSSFPTDAENAFIINEAARNLFGWQSAVGRNLKIGVDWKKGTIIGVVKDFHFESLHGEVKPVVLF